MDCSRAQHIPTGVTAEMKRGIGAFVVLSAIAAGPTSAQQLRGHLLDLETDEPITAGVLTLLTEDGTRVATTLTGEDGTWVLVAPGPGVYLVEAKRLGYQPWIDGPVELQRGDIWESLYHLRPLAVELDPVEITAEATQRYLELVGFYERQRADFGHYMNREDIERRQGSTITDLLATVPGVRLVPAGDGSGRLFIQMRGSVLTRGDLCRPRVYVDGIIFSRGDSRPIGVDEWGDPTVNYDGSSRGFMDSWDMGINDVAHPSSIAGIEVYRSGSQVPVKFGGTSVETMCGVIVIWTRVGEMKRQGR